MENESEKSSSINSAIYILLLTAISYVGAYTYELGYLKNFAVPQEFIKININSLIISGLAIMSVSMIIIQLMSVIALIVRESLQGSWFAFIFDKYSITFVPLVILSLLSDISLLHMFFLIVVIHPMMWIHLITAIFIMKRHDSYKDAFFYSVDIELNSNAKSEGVKSSNYEKYFNIVLFSIYVLFASSVVGHQSSVHKDEFLVDNKNRVVLRVYDGTAIMGFLDNEKLTKKFVIAELKDLELEKKKMNITIIREQNIDDKLMDTIESIYGYLNNLFSA